MGGVFELLIVRNKSSSLEDFEFTNFFCKCLPLIKTSGPRGYKTSIILNSDERKIYPAHKC